MQCCAHGAGVSKVAGPSLTNQIQETTSQQCTPHNHPNRCEPQPGYHEHNMMYAHSHKQALHKITGLVNTCSQRILTFIDVNSGSFGHTFQCAVAVNRHSSQLDRGTDIGRGERVLRWSLNSSCQMLFNSIVASQTRYFSDAFVSPAQMLCNLHDLAIWYVGKNRP